MESGRGRGLVSRDEEEDLVEADCKLRSRRRRVIGDSSNCKEMCVLKEFGGLRDETNGRVDADYSYFPSINDEISLMILARVPRSEYPKLRCVNRRYQCLVRSGQLYAIRKEIGISEPSVLMLASGELHWWSYDPRSSSRRNLPILPCDPCFSSSDKESLSCGTHLLVSGKEVERSAIWRYELVADRWFKGPAMISSRCLFASASCGDVACVAGGLGTGPSSVQETLNTAEKYDPKNKSWDPLPRMHRRRKLCSGCHMDNKFYVIGGLDENGNNLQCGEFYDPETNAWVLIPDMLKDAPSWSSRSPPLIAVANNELYSLEASSNKLKVYLKKSNSWKDLGKSPVRADHSRGWGVAFKSLGDELLVIGNTAERYTCRGMTICACRPDPGSDVLEWKVLESDDGRWSSFIFNCSIMVA